ncbi:mitochondrial cardiolipin hydrolase [Lucilia sericata]|uniref:mitochondrial cardiolipin hydrolase n=1 Tax=Lucilia sericata TaxID=13632 RepID=UPI0018A84DF1|nr:mitochondrial cardiolipin hydrolase [Lucilia sericata]
MLENSILRYCLYGSCVIISSEILYHSYYWLKKKLEQHSSAQEVHEVIWTNELTQSCAARHRFNSTSGASPSSTPTSVSSSVMSSQGRIVKLPTSQKTAAKCPNPFCAAYNVGRLIEFVDSAKYSIDLAMYTFTSFELSQAFIRALKRGVLIRIISDKEMAYSSGSQIVSLTKAGVPIRCNTNTMFMHHKFCILDSPLRVAAIHKKQNKSFDKGQNRSILMTGSLNWTMQGFGGNWENILITSNFEYINKYSQEFERMWHVFDVDLKVNNKN